ncbi:hypothetical protein GCM10011609_36840 [Lentzea pudingi]|uniref:Uncharacterized protein n=1 Tax=Lentzea pudingi TaxID=1789439 RepID=A0ABQ2HZ11_9PSEU|nr:hypothetical protein GCM10011609_36840 [Lentzea pudingi]
MRLAPWAGARIRPALLPAASPTRCQSTRPAPLPERTRPAPLPVRTCPDPLPVRTRLVPLPVRTRPALLPERTRPIRLPKRTRPAPRHCPNQGTGIGAGFPVSAFQPIRDGVDSASAWWCDFRDSQESFLSK